VDCNAHFVCPSLVNQLTCVYYQVQSVYTCICTQTESYSSPLVVSQDTF
jgi:hypothetical protein